MTDPTDIQARAREIAAGLLYSSIHTLCNRLTKRGAP